MWQLQVLTNLALQIDITNRQTRGLHLTFYENSPQQ